MFVQCSRVDEDVVDVHVCETTAVREEVVHGALKCTGGVATSKRHYAELEAPKLGMQRGSRDMPWFYAILVLALLEVRLGEVLRACHAFQQLVNARHGVRVLDGDSIECAVVDTTS